MKQIGVATPERRLLSMSEEQFLSWLLELAARFGWQSAHVGFPARMVGGGKLVPDARARGFPDVVLVRGERLVFSELKTDCGRASKEQLDWLQALRDAGAESYLWRPKDRDVVEQVLR